MQLFYNPKLVNSDNVFTFDKNESHHLIKVLRMRKGEKIFVTNGLGSLFESEIFSENPNGCEVKIISSSYRKPKKYNIHLAVSLIKSNDRFEWFIEKATEIGVDFISPLICRRSLKKEIKQDRLKKLIVSASKQSLRVHFPIINKPVSFNEFVKKKTVTNKFIANCLVDINKSLKKFIIPGKDTIIMIGPEGDFTSDEIQTATDCGYKLVSLGNNRLRTETAAVIACHTIKLLND